ncbi:hypothetical protein IGI04_030872 [Brassica rapa subsp. trilocularis]|uniref:Uncharacterized protein n=1 Tax=Brassica rapa subsp. trilocularis TaxID=1813537 RepID=A0ABQ7LVY9_BRACM|nr:hypothetical protein IGI04_030872 [Brassica rapa subsp. trilocularis]
MLKPQTTRRKHALHRPHITTAKRATPENCMAFLRSTPGTWSYDSNLHLLGFCQWRASIEITRDLIRNTKPPHPSTTDSSSTPRTPSSPDLKIPNFNRPRSRSPPRRTNHQPQSSKSPQSCRRPSDKIDAET